MNCFSDMHRDALCELFNIGMGHAAASLSEMLADEIVLTIPFLDCIDVAAARQMLRNPEADRLDAVEQQFDGRFSGNAYLFFSEQSSLELVRRILGSEVSLEMLSELEHEALKEVSNIILNACFGCIADILQCELESGIPHLLSGDLDDIMAVDRLGLGSDAMVLILSMSFCLPNKEISGKVSFVMTAAAMDLLIRELDRYLEHYL